MLFQLIFLQQIYFHFVDVFGIVHLSVRLLFVCLSICPYVYLSICSYVSPLVCRSVCPSAFLSICPFCLFVRLSICLFVRWSICPRVYLYVLSIFSVCIFVRLYICPFVYLSVCQCVRLFVRAWKISEDPSRWFPDEMDKGRQMVDVVVADVAHGKPRSWLKGWPLWNRFHDTGYCLYHFKKDFNVVYSNYS